MQILLKGMAKIFRSHKSFESFQELLKRSLYLANLKIYVADLCMLSNLYKLQFLQFSTLTKFASYKVN